MSESQARVALITGASRGIGAYLAQELWNIADIVVICARQIDGLNKTAIEIEHRGGTAHPVAVDLCQKSDRLRLLEVIDNLGTLDVVIHNAGVEYAMAFEEQSHEQIHRQLDLNAVVPIALTRHILPRFRERGYGRMVFISSMSGKSPTPYNSVYSATKYALNGFVASLALELSETDIHVGVVCPSFVADAGMWADTGVKAPPLMKEVPLQKVCAAVQTILDCRKTEVLVTPTPVRPLLALYILFPSLGPWLLKRLGVWAVLQKRRRIVEGEHGHNHQ